MRFFSTGFPPLSGIRPQATAFPRPRPATGPPPYAARFWWYSIKRQGFNILTKKDSVLGCIRLDLLVHQRVRFAIFNLPPSESSTPAVELSAWIVALKCSGCGLRTATPRAPMNFIIARFNIVTFHFVTLVLLLSHLCFFFHVLTIHRLNAASNFPPACSGAKDIGCPCE